MRGILQNNHSGYTAVNDFFVQHTLSTLTLSNTGSISEIESERVEIRPTSISLTDDAIQDLHQEIQPLRNSESWGVDIYLETMSYMERILNTYSYCYFIEHSGMSALIVHTDHIVSFFNCIFFAILCSKFNLSPSASCIIVLMY